MRAGSNPVRNALVQFIVFGAIMLRPQTDFEYSIVLLVKLLCADLGIMDITTPTTHKVFKTFDDNRERYVRSYRKVRRRIARLANVNVLKEFNKHPRGSMDRLRLERSMYKASRITPAYVECYLVDVVCMLIDGDIKRNTLTSDLVRLYDEKSLYRHVRRMFRSKISVFSI